MTSRSPFKKRPPAAPKRDNPITQADRYFSHPDMVVRRGELQAILAGLERARRIKDKQSKWYRRLWAYLMQPFVKTPATPAPNAPPPPSKPEARGKFDASGRAIAHDGSVTNVAPDEKKGRSVDGPTEQQAPPKPSIEIASR